MAQQSTTRMLVFTAAVFAGMYLVRDGMLNRPAPAFSLPDVYGGRVNLADYRGRPLLLVFWTTSCPICRHELPLVSRLAPEFRSKGIGVAAICLGEADDARGYIGTNHINVTALADADGAIGQAYRVSGVPKLVLVGADGKIKRSSSGMASEAVLRAWMDQARGL